MLIRSQPRQYNNYVCEIHKYNFAKNKLEVCIVVFTHFKFSELTVLK